MNRLPGLVLAAILVWAAVFGLAGRSEAGELVLLAGAGLRPPVERLVNDFNKGAGFRTLVDYAGSGHLLTRILATKLGDLYLPGALEYIQRLQGEGLIESFRSIVCRQPVVVVNRRRAGDKVHRLEDLTRPGLRVGLGDPKAMAFGRIAADILSRAGLAEEVAPNVVVYAATVKQLVLYVAEGHLDAAIVDHSDAFLFREQVALVPIPPEYIQVETVPIAVLTTTSNLDWARQLQDYLCSPEAVRVFETFGFLPLSPRPD